MGTDFFRSFDATGRADVGDLVVYDDGAERGFVQALTTDDDGCTRERVAGEHRGKICRWLIEGDQCEGHFRGLWRLARHELETRGAHPKTERELGLAGEPGAMRCAIRKNKSGTGHGGEVGWCGRGVKPIFCDRSRII